MIRNIVLVALVLMPAVASAKDVALMLNDQEQAGLRQVLDSATRDEGIKIAPLTVYLMNKLNNAPAVVEHKDEPKPADPKPDAPSSGDNPKPTDAKEPPQ